MKITALAGGVGGAKLVDGLAAILPPESLTVIVNTGDDFEHFGLSVSPDLDTVCYTLAGLSNEVTGWGRKDETWKVLEELKKLGGPSWFNIGDLDLATHLERTRRLAAGEKLTSITQSFCQRWGINHRVFPMSDTPVHTLINTKEMGWLPFQEYFVKYQCAPTMLQYKFENIEQAKLPQEAKQAIQEADWVIVCPSNPFVSIEPIYRIENLEADLIKKNVLAVSPIIGGKALKGPAAKMFGEMGFVPSAYEVLKRYQSFLSVFWVENGDAKEIEYNDHWNIMIKESNTIMSDKHDRMRLAKEIVEFIGLTQR